MIKWGVDNIGVKHGDMRGIVRNPFRTPFMRRNFDAAISAYDDMNKDFITADGRRCRGNSWANHFWNGFDNAPADYTGMKDSVAYAMYRAGESIADVIATFQEAQP